MVMNVNYIINSFAIYTNIESCCILKINILLYVNYTSIKKKQKECMAKLRKDKFQAWR